MYIHTHTPENCWAAKTQEAMRLFSEVREGFQREGVKCIGAYAAAHEHTFYWVLESDNIIALEHALRPMLTLGNARLVPVQDMPWMKS